ncbi:MAG: hypothetical protein ACRDTJ_04355 [Pseudonocardiaceae bacterium]
MPEKTPAAASVVTHAVMNLLQYGLMLWAAIETTGLLHWALVGYLAFCAVAIVFHTSATAMTKRGA